MNTKKPLEQIIEDEQSLRFLEVVGYLHQFADSFHAELEELLVAFSDMILEPYTPISRGFDADLQTIIRLDSLIQGRDTKEEFIKFIKSRQGNQD